MTYGCGVFIEIIIIVVFLNSVLGVFQWVFSKKTKLMGHMLYYKILSIRSLNFVVIRLNKILAGHCPFYQNRYLL